MTSFGAPKNPKRESPFGPYEKLISVPTDTDREAKGQDKTHAVVARLKLNSHEYLGQSSFPASIVTTDNGGARPGR